MAIIRINLKNLIATAGTLFVVALITVVVTTIGANSETNEDKTGQKIDDPWLAKKKQLESQDGMEQQRASWLAHCPQWNREGQAVNSRFEELVNDLKKKGIAYQEIADKFLPYRDLDCVRIWDEEVPSCKQQAMKDTNERINFDTKVRNCLNRNQWNKNRTPQNKQVVAKLEYLALQPTTIQNRYKDIPAKMIAVQKVQVKPDTYDSKNPAYTARLGPCAELWRYGAQYGCAFMRLSSASPWTALGIHEDDVVLYVDDTRVFDAKLLTEKTKSLFEGKQSTLRLAIDRHGQFYEITATGS